ncbi:MAG: arsenite methyltransferase, partial [Akkermansiaceae bacterium]
TADLPEEILNNKSMFTGCMAGATYLQELEGMIKDAGFTEISIRPKDESKEFIRDWAPGSNIENYIVSASIEAVKPR